MSPKEAKKLRKGDRVRFDDGTFGTVKSRWQNSNYPNLGSVYIEWEDGDKGDIDWNDMGRIVKPINLAVSELGIHGMHQ